MLVSELEKQLKQLRETVGDVEITGCRKTVSSNYTRHDYNFEIVGVQNILHWFYVLIQRPQKPKRQPKPTLPKNEAKAKGGYAKNAKLTPEQRSDFARKMAKARWNK